MRKYLLLLLLVWIPMLIIGCAEDTTISETGSNLFLGVCALLAFFTIIILRHYFLYLFSLKPFKVLLNRRKVGVVKTWKGIPYNGDLRMAATAYNNYSFQVAKSKSNIIRALLFRLLNEGCLAAEADVVKVVSPNGVSSPIEEQFFKMLYQASDHNHSLLEGNVSVYAVEHARVCQCFLSELLEDVPYDKNDIESVRNLLGLRKYLREFSSISDRSDDAVKMWKEYIAYAHLFGIGDSVVTRVEKLWPEFFEKM